MLIRILGVPMAKQSFKMTKKGFKYTDKKVVDWKSQARAQLVQQLPKSWIPIATNVCIADLKFVFPIPKSFSKSKLEHLKSGVVYYKPTKPDIDNLMKQTWDSCEGILFLNDSQIVIYKGEICKIYGEVPRVEFFIR